jgi:hypothetical protein
VAAGPERRTLRLRSLVLKLSEILCRTRNSLACNLPGRIGHSRRRTALRWLVLRRLTLRWLVLGRSPALGLKCANSLEDERSFMLVEVVCAFFSEVHLHHQLLFIHRRSSQHVLNRGKCNMSESLGTMLG